MSPNLSMNKTKVLASVDFQKKGVKKFYSQKTCKNEHFFTGFPTLVRQNEPVSSTHVELP